MLNCILDSLVCNCEVSEAVALAQLDVLLKYYFDVINMILLSIEVVMGPPLWPRSARGDREHNHANEAVRSAVGGGAGPAL